MTTTTQKRKLKTESTLQAQTETLCMFLGDAIRDRQYGWAFTPVSRRGSGSESYPFLGVSWKEVIALIDTLNEESDGTLFAYDGAKFREMMDQRLAIDPLFDRYIGRENEVKCRFWSREGWRQHLELRDKKYPMFPTERGLRTNSRCGMYPLEWFGLTQDDVVHYGRYLASDVNKKRDFVEKPYRNFAEMGVSIMPLGIIIDDSTYTDLEEKYPTLRVVSAIRAIVENVALNVPNDDMIRKGMTDDKYRLGTESAPRRNLSVTQELDNKIRDIANANRCSCNTVIRAILTGVFSEFAADKSLIA